VASPAQRIMLYARECASYALLSNPQFSDYFRPAQACLV
jgi:hypothetical protein